MPLLNYTTTVPVAKTVGEIHGLLVQAGARSIMTEYGAAGSPVSITFGVETGYGFRSFVLPAQITSVAQALRAERVAPRFQTPEQAERVGWRILKDWVEAQLALIKVGMATLDQVMLPYMQGEGGATVYELYRDRQLALGTGSDA